MAPGPHLTNTYDSMGRLQKLTDVPSQTDIISNTTYNPAGQLLTTAGVNGAPSETRTYNSIGQLTQLNVCLNFSGYCPTSINTQYAYSATQNNGKITSETDVLSGEQVAYTYDSLNRLASATSSVNPGWGQSYAYDGFGNLTTQTVTKGTAPSLSVSYDPATNRRSGESADANGNIWISGQWCSYDIENRLVGVATSYPQSPYVAYSYAPGNKRVWRGVWNGSTQTVDEVTFWGANGQRLGTWALSMYYGQFVATATGTNYYFGGKMVKNAGGYVGFDRLGSNGKYFPYGQERPSATTDGKEKFATYFRDSETGLDYANNRYHQPGMGRFTSPDPYKASGGPSDPGSWNRYAYTGGDPVNRVDPIGLAWDSITVYGHADDGNDVATTMRSIYRFGFLANFSVANNGEDPFGSAGLVQTAGGSAPTAINNFQGLNSSIFGTLNSALAGTDCGSWFQAGFFTSRTAPSASLSDWLTNVLPQLVGAGDFVGGNSNAVSAGPPIPENYLIAVNNQGAFFKEIPQGQTIGGGNVYGAQLAGINGGSTRAQGFLMLHEIAHIFGMVQDDADPNQTTAYNANAVRHNNDQIWLNCGSVLGDLSNKGP